MGRKQDIQPQHPQDDVSTSSGNPKRNAVTYFIAAVALVITLVQLLDHPWIASHLDSFQGRLADIVGTDYDEHVYCSGHGVVVHNGKCLCDLGYAGATCFEAVSNELTEPTPNTLLLVTEHFGSFHSKKSFESQHHYLLSKTMKEAGYKMTVLYTGFEEIPHFSRIQAEFQEQGIQIVRLSDHLTGLSYGQHPVERKSYEVYQYLLHSANQYSVVHFEASSGAAYYTLLAQKQGLICSKTKFIVDLEQTSQADLEMLERDDQDHVVTDIQVLKLDYMVRASAEMAPTLVVSSKFLLDHVHEQGWNISTLGTHVIDMIPMASIQGPGGKSVKVKEWVFVGSLTAMDGIKVFCDAIDLLAPHVSSPLSISFVGIPQTIEELPSDEWIEVHASSWDEYNIQWDIHTVDDIPSILDYLAQDPGRVAVLPSLFDASGVLSQELLYGGFPFISSTQSAIKDMIHLDDKNKVLVKPTAEDLHKKLNEVMGGQAIIPRAIASKSSSIESWIDLHTQLLMDDSSTCVDVLEQVADLPLVSIVLVHHNRGNMLKQVVESIEAQTYPNIEVILVDDGSTDKASIKMMESITWGWWENRGWKVIREKNKYLGAARNTGVKHAAGKYVVFMDDDDLAKPHQVETFVRVAMKTNADFITSGHDVFSGMHSPVGGRSSERYLPLGPATLVGMLENVFGDSKMCVNREAFINVGGFTEDYGVGFEDYEFLAKMALKKRHIEAVSEPLNWYRRHADTMSYSTNLKTNQLRMLRAYIAENEDASRQQKALLQYTQEMFFDRHGVRAHIFEHTPTNTSVPTRTKTATMTATPTVINRCPGLADCKLRCPGEPGYPWGSSCTSNDLCVPFEERVEFDLCNICGGNNTACTAFKGAEPNVLVNRKGAQFSLYGAGFNETTLVYVNNTLMDPSEYQIGGAQYLLITLPEEYAFEGFTVTLPIRVEFWNVHRNVSMMYKDLLTLYQPEMGVIESITPTEMLTSTTQELVLRGQFLDFTSSICVFNSTDGPSFTYSSVRYIDSGEIRCTTPSFAQGRLLSVNVMYSTPKYPTEEYTDKRDVNRPAYFLDSTDPLYVRVYSKAPSMSKAIFDNTGASILVTFNNDVGIIENYNRLEPVNYITLDKNGIPCSYVFNQTALSAKGIFRRNGIDADCTLNQIEPNILRLTLSAQLPLNNVDAIKPADILVLNKDVIVQTDSVYAYTASGSVTVDGPTNPPVPVILLEVPTRINNCTNVTLDLSAVSGAAGRKWKNVTVSVDLGNDDLDALLETSSADIQSGDITRFTIPSDYLEAGEYDFLIYFENFLGGKNDYKFTLTVTEGDDAPTLLVKSPLTGSFLNWDISERNQLFAVVQPSCTDPRRHILFQWTQLAGPEIDIGDDSDKPNLAFAPYSLNPGTSYTFRLETRFEDREDLEFSLVQDVTITTKYQLFVSAGSSRSVSRQRPLTVKAVIFDPSYLEFDSSRYECQWTCISVPDTNPCIFSGRTFTSGSSCEFTVPANSIPAGDYAFSVSARNKDLGTSFVAADDQAFISVATDIIPVVDIVPSELNPTTDSRTFYLKATPSDFVGANLLYSWSSEAVCNGKTYVVANVEEATSRTSPDSPYVKFQPFTLLPYTTYCIRINVEDVANPSSRTAVATVIVHIRGSPEGGQCKLTSPSTGIASQDDFSMECFGWVTDPLSLPLNYEFSAATSEESDYTIVSSASYKPTFAGKFPEGSYLLKPIVGDAMKSRNATLAASSITATAVQPSTLAKRSLQDTLDALEDIASQYDVAHNYEDALKSIALIAMQLPSDISSSEDALEIQTAIIDLLHVILSDGYWVLDQYKEAPFAGSLVSKLMGTSYTLPYDNAYAVYNVSGVFGQSASLAASPKGCYEQAVATQFLAGMTGGISSIQSLDAFCPECSQTLYSYANDIHNCVLKTQVCSEIPYEFSLESATNVVGISSLTAMAELPESCPFNATFVESSTQPDACINYKCGSLPTESYVNTSQIDVKIASTLKTVLYDQFVYLDMSNTSDSSRVQSVSGFIDVDSSFTSLYNLTNFNVSNTKRQYVPIVVRVDFRTVERSFAGLNAATDDVKLTQIVDDTFYFTSSVPGMFAVGVIENNMTAICTKKNCNGDCEGDSEFDKWVTDCRNLCVLKEDAFVTDCFGNCVNPAYAAVIDDCGVCGGDGTSCLDCLGVKNGTAIKDKCGVCNGDGTSPDCFGLVAVEPYVVKNAVGSEIVLVGGGFKVGDYVLEDERTVVVINDQPIDDSWMTYSASNGYEYITIKLEQPLVSTSINAKVSVSDPKTERLVEVSFYLYTPQNEPEINTLTPTKLYTNKLNQQIVFGSSYGVLPEFKDAIPRCVYFMENVKNTVVGARDPSTGTYKCTLPSLSTSGDLDAHLMYSTPEYPTPDYADKNDYFRPELFVSQDASLGIKVFSAEPFLVTDQTLFTTSGSSILVTFDKNVMLVSPSDYEEGKLTPIEITDGLTCDYAFETTNTDYGLLAREGHPTDCMLSFLSPTTLRLTLAGVFTLTPENNAIEPGDLLGVKANSIVSSGYMYSDAASSSIVVGKPKNIPVPSVQVSAPSILGSCPDYDLDLSLVSGSGGRVWKTVTLEVLSVESDITYQTPDAIKSALNEYLAGKTTSLARGETLLPLDNTIMPPGKFSFKLLYENFLGGTAFITFSAQRMASDDVPYIVLSSDSGVKDVAVDGTIILGAKAIVQTTGKCASATPKEVEFEWSSSDVDVSEQRTKSAVALKPYTLKPKKDYTFTVLANYKGSDAYSFSITIGTAKDQIFANSGSSKTLGNTNDVLLAATIIDSSYPLPLDLTMFSCSWACVKVADDSDCGLADLNACSVNAGKLPVGQYKFTVSVENSETGSFAQGVESAVITIKEGKIPVADIFATELSPGSYSDDFYMRADVDSTTVDNIVNVNYVWSSEATCNGKSYATLTLDGANTLTGNNGQFMKFVPGKLKPSASYCFKVAVTEKGYSGQGEAMIIIKIRDAPSGGVCNIDGASTGSAFADRITFRCTGWVTDPLSYPLSYEFYVKNAADGLGNNEGWQLLKAAGPSSRFTSVYSQGSYKIKAVVKDKALSVNSVDQTGDLTIGESLLFFKLAKRQTSNSYKAAISFVTNSTTMYKSTQDYESAATAAAIASGSLPNNVNLNTDATTLHLAITKLINEMVTSGNWYLDTIKQGPMAASLLKGTVGKDYRMGTDSSESVFNLTNLVTNQIGSNAPTNCYGDASARNFLTSLDAVISSMTRTGYDQSVSDAWMTALKQINMCQYNKLICGQTPFSFPGQGITQYTVGVKNSDSDNNYCSSWVVENLSSTTTPATSGCVRFSCREFKADGVLPNSRLRSAVPDAVDMSNVTTSLLFYIEDREISIKNGKVNGQINLDQSFFNKYFSGSYYIPQVVRINFTDSSKSFGNAQAISGGTQVTSISGNTVKFQADQAGAYAVVAKLGSTPASSTTATSLPTGIVPTPSTPPTPGGASGGGSSAGIIAGVIVAIVVVGAAAAFGVRRSRQRKAAAMDQKEAPAPQQPAAALDLPVETTAAQADKEVIIQVFDGPTATVRKRDPAFLPAYQPPPTYAEFMASRGVNLEHLIDMPTVQP